MLFIGSFAYKYGLFQYKLIVQVQLGISLLWINKTELTGFICPWEELGENTSLFCAEQKKNQVSKKLHVITNRQEFMFTAKNIYSQFKRGKLHK